MKSISFITTVFTVSLFIPANAQNTNRSRPASNETVMFIFMDMDNNGDKKISFDEAQGQLKSSFNRNDTNKDGYLTQNELQALADRLSAGRNRNAGASRDTPPATGSTMSTKDLLEMTPQGVTVVPDIAYREGHDAWKLDLAMPSQSSDTPRPAIIYIHGGGWTKGDKRGQGIATVLGYAKKGFVSLSVNYRLDADKKACIEDVKCATRWLRAHAKEYNVDPDRIGAAGNSAGAHLALMLAICPLSAGLEGDGPYQQYSSGVQAAHCSSTPAKPNYRTREGDSTEYSNIQAMTYISADTPPLYFIHGLNDTQKAPIQFLEAFVDALAEAGAKDVTYKRYDDAGHGVYVQHIDEARPAREAFLIRTLMN